MGAPPGTPVQWGTAGGTMGGVHRGLTGDVKWGVLAQPPYEGGIQPPYAGGFSTLVRGGGDTGGFTPPAPKPPHSHPPTHPFSPPLSIFYMECRNRAPPFLTPLSTPHGGSQPPSMEHICEITPF